MLRITGGEFRGRSIETLKTNRTRPTQAKLRQALFNSVQFLLPEARVLDLFAGSGALAFEALSRGAESAVLVELSRKAGQLIEKNARDLGVQNRIELVAESVERFQKAVPWEPFNLVVADPPYEAGWETRLLNDFPWERLLKPGGRFCLEWGLVKSQLKELPERVPFLVKTREKNYGDSVLTTYQREES
jgi:16S rRNA (guanine966-N2)-methyltransferase